MSYIASIEGEDNDLLAVPSETQTRSIVDEGYNRLFATPPQVDELGPWIFDLYEIPRGTKDWRVINMHIGKESYYLARVRAFCHKHKIDDEEDIAIKLRAMDVIHKKIRKNLHMTAGIVSRLTQDCYLIPHHPIYGVEYESSD